MHTETLFPLFDTGVEDSGNTEIRFFPDMRLPFQIPDEQVAIAEMADLFGVTHRTLHFYEEKGLIVAERSGTMRVYGRGHILRMAVVNACREIGIPILVIQELMEELASAASLSEADEIFHAMLGRRKRELTADVSHIRRQMQQIESLLQGDDDAPDTDRGGAMLLLTEPEKRCLDLMAEGYSAPRIARALQMDFSDLREVEDSLVRKFQATNRFQAVAKAVLLGLVPH